MAQQLWCINIHSSALTSHCCFANAKKRACMMQSSLHTCSRIPRRLNLAFFVSVHVRCVSTFGVCMQHRRVSIDEVYHSKHTALYLHMCNVLPWGAACKHGLMTCSACAALYLPERCGSACKPLTSKCKGQCNCSETCSCCSTCNESSICTMALKHT